MTAESLLVTAGAIVAVAGVVYIVARKLPKKMKSVHFTRKWRDIQKLCADKTSWPEAIINADKLLDEALVRKRINGKTMGERLVGAEDDFTNKDAVWKSHKLAGLLQQENEEVKLKENDVKVALVSFRQALKDLGAL